MDWFIYGLCLGLLGAGLLLLCQRRPGGALRERTALAGREWRAFLAQGGWKSSPAGAYVLGLLQEGKRRRLEAELGQALSYLGNAAAMGRGDSMSTGLILEELWELQGELAPVYLKMLQYLRLNEKERMVAVLKEATDSPLAADFAGLLLQWEELPPVLLLESLEAYRKNINQLRLTRQKKRDEAVSDFIYLPVILNVMLVLLNFIYVAYFIEQRAALLEAFG